MNSSNKGICTTQCGKGHRLCLPPKNNRNEDEYHILNDYFTHSLAS